MCFSTILKSHLLLRIIVHKLFTDYYFYMPSYKYLECFTALGAFSDLS